MCHPRASSARVSRFGSRPSFLTRRTKAGSDWTPRTSTSLRWAPRRSSRCGSWANLGLGILADPTRGDRQNDVLTYGVSLARAMTSAAEVVAEVNGHVDTREGPPLPGTESRSLGRIGARYTIGGWRADGAVLFGFTVARSRHRPRGGFHVCVRRLSSSVRRNWWPVDFYPDRSLTPHPCRW